jgi:acyl-CoA dehydrogenase
MSDELRMLEQTLAELFAAEAEDGADAAALWTTLEDAGLTLAGVPEAAGGSGGGAEEAAAVIRAAARVAAPGPLAETGLLAGWLLAEAGHTVPDGMLGATAGDGISLRPDGDGWLLDGVVQRVPHGRDLTALAVLAGGQVALVPGTALTVAAEGANIAGEPRDDLRLAAVRLPAAAVRPAPAHVTADALALRGAVARAVALSGALERVLELTVTYAGEREQFGRPIGKFQAIQQDIAILAGEVAAARAAADAAVERPDDLLRVATAKLRAGDAATRAAEIAHQVHGAIGYTEEHRLHRFTLRLWAWRDEHGSEELWAARLGRCVAAAGADGLWHLLTDTTEEQ